jgi:hypothetical protein
MPQFDKHKKNRVAPAHIWNWKQNKNLNVLCDFKICPSAVQQKWILT